MSEEARVKELTAALQAEWESNHDEHCSNFPKPDCESFGGSKHCYWPRPKALEPAPNSALTEGGE